MSEPQPTEVPTTSISAIPPVQTKEEVAAVKSEPVSEIPTDFTLYNPPAGGTAGPSRELPDSYFDPTANELKAAYYAQVKAREALQNAPLKTQQIRERELKAKLQRYPNTRIRVKFPDRSQLEKTFHSTDKIKSVYAFVRSLLREDVRPIKFVLYQSPPRRELKVSDPAVKNLSLFELELSPSSVLMISFFEESLNDHNLRPPLLESVLAQSKDLPPPPSFESAGEKDGGKSWKNNSTQLPKDISANKGIPKWLKIGQKK